MLPHQHHMNTSILNHPFSTLASFLFVIFLLGATGTYQAAAQTPDYWIHSPGSTGVNNLYLHGGVCQKFVFSYSAAEWAAVGLPGAIPYTISSIWFRGNTAGLVTYTDFKVQIGHSTLAAPVANFLANFDVGAPVTGLDEATFTIDFVAGPFGTLSDGWTRINLSTPFTYNATDSWLFWLS
jgi:hypothetical protein